VHRTLLVSPLTCSHITRLTPVSYLRPSEQLRHCPSQLRSPSNPLSFPESEIRVTRSRPLPNAIRLTRNRRSCETPGPVHPTDVGAPHAPGAARLIGLVERRAPWLLAMLVALVYLPSVPGDFLVYDDVWLIELNRVLLADWGQAFRSIFSDFSLPTRLSLGAEYLPLRDLSYFLDVRGFGFGPNAMRLEQILLYAAAVLLLRSALVACLPSRIAAEVASWCFALHPVHVESVAWIAGRKDVLALLFVAAALRAYEFRGAARWVVVPLLACAHFSKSMSVIAAGLLVAQDLLARRRPNWGIVSASSTVAVLSLALHRSVGLRVGMLEGALLTSPWATFCTMGSVWLAYLKVLFWPPALSLVHEVTRLDALSVRSVLGWLVLASGGLLGAFRLRQRQSALLGGWLWAVLPLAPVSQLFFPLQNVMADRYLWLSTMAMGLGLGYVWKAHRAGAAVVIAVLGVLLVGSTWRAAQFGDGESLFSRETRVTGGSLAPYLLGKTLERKSNIAGAEAAYRQSIERPCEPRCEPARRSSNDLARLVTADGNASQAEPILREAIRRFPDDPDAHFNLVKVLYRMGRTDEARAVYDKGVARFPGYDGTGKGGPRL
jgi:protein O-mannosyl-transferase